MHPNMHLSERRPRKWPHTPKNRSETRRLGTNRVLENAPPSEAQPSRAKSSQRLGDTRKFRADVRTLARQFGRTHSEEWKRNPRKARELAVRYFRKYLPQGKPGRPRSSDVTCALLMRERGKRWSEIYGVLFPDRDADRRRSKQVRLRAAVRFRITHIDRKRRKT